MIGPYTGFFVTLHSQLLPCKWCFINVQAPDIVDRFGACIASKDDQVRLAENYGVAVPPAWRAANHRNDHPLGRCITVAQIKQVEIVRCQTTT